MTGETEGALDRAGGPWDRSEVPDEKAASMVDLGGLLIPAGEGIDIQVQVDQQSGQVATVTLVAGDGAVQVQPYAAPKSSGLWAEVRGTLRGSISSSGGLVDEVDGELGIELRARVSQPGGALQPARFVGVDGPRWFLRGVFLGSAADPSAAARVTEAFRSVVVVRGQDAMAPGDPIALRMPMADGSPESRPQRINPFVRGPEITEIR